MAGRSFVRARDPRLRLVLPRAPGSVAVSHGHLLSSSSAAPHVPTVTRGTPRSHHGGLAEGPGARRGPDDRTAEGRRQGRRAWTSLAARPRPSAFRGCPVRADAHLLRSPSPHAPARVDRLPASRPRSRSSSRGDRLRERWAPVPLGPFGRAVASSSPSAPPMKCPGSGLQPSRRLGFKALRSLRRSQGSRRPTSGRRWRSCLRRRGNLLASQVPRRGHLHYLQRHPRARTLSLRKGDSLGSFRGPQLRTLCATSGDAFRIGSG